MDPGTVAIVALVVPAAVMGVVSSVLVKHQRRRELEEKRAGEVWERLAQQFNLTFTHGYLLEDRMIEREVAGFVAGLKVHLEAVSAMPGRSGWSTRCWVQLEHCPLPAIEVQVNQPHALIERDPTLSRVLLGDASFDQLMEVRGDDPCAVCRVLRADVRAAMLALVTVAPNARIRASRVEWEEPGDVFELSRLRDILNRLIDVALVLRASAREGA